MKIHWIGTGTPTPTPQRFGTCYVVEVCGRFLMFDCGPAATFKMVRAGLFPTQIHRLFLTHHHFDHIADLPCFLLTRWDQCADRCEPLKIFGPAPAREIVEKLIGAQGAFLCDWNARLNDPGSKSVFENRGGVLPRKPPAADVEEIDSGWVWREGGLSVSAIRTVHAEPWLITLAYRLDTPDGSLGLIGDAEPTAAVCDFMRGVDCLITHCWGFQDEMDANGEDDGQTGTIDAAQMGSDTGAGTLVLSHCGGELASVEGRAQAIAQIQKHFAGEIIFAEEGGTLLLGEDKNGGQPA